MKTLTILYPGEMGSAVAGEFSRHGWRVVSCLDDRSRRTKDLALASGVVPLPTIEDCVRESDLVISLVPQSVAESTAAIFAAACAEAARQPAYVDANSISPSTMGEVARVVAGNGPGCVDGAFIGSAAMLGKKTALYLSGPTADSVSTQIGDALLTRVLGPEIGDASAFKLSIYGFNKGLVAIFLEMITAADLLGHREELLACLRDFYPGQMSTVERLLPTYPRHVSRRVDEMSEVVDWLASIRQRSDMAAGTRSIFQCLESLALDDGPREFEELVDEYCRRRPLSITRGEDEPGP
jgi:3-hydroxyisobutyrate dehydrogenase-like beta-hydroxyacid dehydrogenase